MSFSFLAPKWGQKRRAVYDQKEKETFKKNHKSEKKGIKKTSQGSWDLVTENLSHQGSHPSCTKTLFQFLESRCFIEP